MTGKPILFLDSGMGGIPYCRHFHNRNPNEAIVYLADRLHFPYGGRDKKELCAILSQLTEKLIAIVNPKITVLACNTASLAALSLLREKFDNQTFVGTIPAVKPAALATKTGKIGVLGTELTINEPYIKKLALSHGGAKIIGIAAPELVEFVEKRLDSASGEEKTAIVQGYLKQFRAAGVDTLVLGCTHFLFLQEDFQREAADDISVFESLEGISKRIESLSGTQQTRIDPPAKNWLLLTGAEKPEPVWVTWAQRLGFNLSLLDAMQDTN